MYPIRLWNYDKAEIIENKEDFIKYFILQWGNPDDFPLRDNIKDMLRI